MAETRKMRIIHSGVNGGDASITPSGVTNVGLQREINEDSFRIVEAHDLYLVADGMGGHKAGDVASGIAVESIEKFFDTTTSEDATWPFPFNPRLSFEENRLVTGIKFANKLIFETSLRDRDVQGMGTTVVSAHLSKESGRLYIAHVGDSRAYLYRNGHLKLLTRDHSLVNDYLSMMPHLTQEERDELPKNVITRALGMQEEVIVDIQSQVVRHNDIYLLCTDGLTGMVDDEGIQQILGACAGETEMLVHELVSRANEEGGDDNITVIALKVDRPEIKIVMDEPEY